MYMSAGMVGMNYARQGIPSTSYTNGPPAKKRRSTASSAPKPQLHSTSLPTPTSATLPPPVKAPGPSASSSADAKPQDPNPPSTSLPPFTPPNLTSSLNPTDNNSNNVSALNLPFSPSFSFSPLPQIASLAPTPKPPQDSSAHQFDPMLSMPAPYDHPTPGAGSTSGSVHTDPEKDPFLSLLEQLAENEVNRGGPSDLDYFLGSASG
jgi:hypothetical protein